MEQKTQNQVATAQKNITDSVLAKIEVFKQAGELKLPKDYSPENALKAAYLVLLETKTSDKKPVLDVCSKESIANSLLKMVVWGLSPLKKQCDFIAYGDKLQCDPEYTGNILLAKRYGGMVDYKPNAIFKGDDFKYEIGHNGRKRIITHSQSLESVGGEVLGAYFWYKLADGTEDVEVMNIVQIRNAWNQGAMKGNSGAHKNFTDQMAIKTVANRACKLLIRASDDAPLMGDAGGTEETTNLIDSAKQEVIEKANAEEIDFEEVKLNGRNSESGKEQAKESCQEAPY